MNILKVVAVTLFVSTPALAVTEEKKNAIENLASLIVASQWCDDYIIRKETILSIAVALKINPNDKNEKALMEEKKTEFQKIMGETGANAYCAYSFKLFGPEGKIPGLMMKK